MSDLTTDPEILQRWVGRRRSTAGHLDVRTASFLADTLDVPLAPGARLPPLWHLAYFLESAPLSRLGRDGHPERGGFLPPVGLARRMWAGGRFEFLHDLQLGTDAEQTSQVLDVVQKSGRSGPLCFVTVEHRHEVNGHLHILERQDLVYRDDPTSDQPAPRAIAPPHDPEFRTVMEASEVMLFRYSALTFNGHRIHYDRTYATEVEGYGGLVVPGPLIATLLAGYIESITGAHLATFSFRATAPVFDIHPFSLNAVVTDTGVVAWAETGSGSVAMLSEATLR